MRQPLFPIRPILLASLAAFTPLLPTPALAVSYNWQLVNPKPVGDLIGGVASDGVGIYVATSNIGGIVRSTDAGATWSAVTPAITGMNAVIWSATHSRFVAVGAGSKCYTSLDGLTWTPSALRGGREMFGVVEGGGILVAVGDQGSVITSSDAGANWTLQSFPTMAFYETLKQVAWNGSQFLAVGGGGSTGSVMMATSPDGVTWTQQDPAAAIAALPLNASSSGFLGATWDGARWVVSTANLYTIASSDGVVWSALNAASMAHYPRQLGWSGLQYCSVGQYGAYVSSDGATWSKTLTGSTSASWTLNSVLWDGVQWVVAGMGGQIFTSPDGITWTERSTGVHDKLSRGVKGNGLFVAVGDAGRIVTSPDGLTWTPQTSGTTASLRDVTWTGTQFVAVGASGALLTSPDGVVWSPQVGNTAIMLRVAWNGVTLVATGYGGGGSIPISWTSPDGVVWTEHASNGSLGTNATGLIWDATLGLFVQAGANGGIATSPDGVTWTPQTSGVATSFSDVTSNGSGLLVAVGLGTPKAVVSSDAVTWTPAPSLAAVRPYGITWDGVRFLIPDATSRYNGATPGVFTSPDGLNWSLVPSDLAGMPVNSALFDAATANYLAFDVAGKIALGKQAANLPPSFTGTPAIANGSAVVGDTLTLSATAATDPNADPLTTTYQWRAAGVAISGATGASYTVAQPQAHQAIDAVVSVDDGFGLTATATTATLTLLNTPPTFTGTPAVANGSALVGDTLTLSGDATSDGDGDTVTLSYQWRAGGVAIPGATAATFTLTSTQAHQAIDCLVTADDGQGGSAPVTTGALILGNMAPAFTGTPAIANGSALVGDTLTLSGDATS
ncbi:MAG: hypothetical protein AUJ55_00160, partial [Proteobacteria bacterium CG1_02_64_396]